ncbi:lycopene cyclase family protein [Thermomonospora cellulosilytica]|uniref:Lycopene beta-cyclase n=1 Tax=Thermomonospora cellulosilytica TaxID=1411118 RepID=A0A7W3MZB1_9ACTN|nr:lycopene cyclase family protein [Thermomonospora cellulosilytica]MBA9004654.1 lycopene beta-cyclase [Thermomonospora cellulosilytica]
MDESEIVVIGAGAAGLSLVHHLTADGASPTVILVDAPEGPLRPPERTWCFWEAGDGDYEEAVVASWPRLRVLGPDGTALVRRPDPLRYKMIRSTGFETFVGRALAARPTVRRVCAEVDTVRNVPGGAEIGGTTAEGRRMTLRARWVYDSRPPRSLPPARSTLLQHFRGWFVRTGRPVFDPDVASLMDFRTPQPARGLSFGYVLPLAPDEALVEYTEFSPAPLGDDAYERALRHYTGEVLKLGALRVRAVEQGVIPMTDAVFPRRVGDAVFRIGTAGGATRPATGYTFAAIQRQSRAIADAYRRGAEPVPPPPYPARSRAMDAVLLRALDRGRVDGAAFFTGLFARTPPERLLRFLDGRSRPWEDIAIGLNTPVWPMLRTAAELPLLPRRRPSRERP